MVWAVRRASRADIPALGDLCRASVGPDDYVTNYLEWVTANDTVHVALDPRDRFVGMAVYRTAFDGTGWLGMARTHREYRRQGVNRAIVESFIHLARRRGHRFLRLWTNAGNSDGVATFGRIGFREVARFTRVQAPPASGAVKSKTVKYDSQAWRRVQASALVRAGRGYAHYGWEFIRLNAAILRKCAESGALRSWRGNLLAVPDTPRPTAEDAILQLTMLAGSTAALLAEGRRIARAEGRPDVGTYVPHTRSFLDAAKRSGFTVVPWGDEAILCELAVPPRTKGRSTGSARAGTTRSSGPCS